MPLLWNGVICVEATPTGDDRIFDAGALYWENLPLPLRWAEEDYGAHDGAEHVGWIEQIARDGNNIVASGHIFDEDFAEYLMQCEQIGVSIDPDNVEFTVEIPPEPVFPGPEGGTLEFPPEKQITHKARIRAATAVDIPAFIEAVIKPVAQPTTVPEQVPSSPPEVVVAASDVVPETAAPTHAGLAVQAEDSGRVLMLQRGMDPTDPHAGKWEFPGGGLRDGEDPFDGACREFTEETGLEVPSGELTSEHVSENGVYVLHVYRTPEEFPLTQHLNDHAEDDNPNDEPLCWWNPADIQENPAVRDEVLEQTPWEAFDMTTTAAEGVARVHAASQESDTLEPVFATSGGGAVDAPVPPDAPPPDVPPLHKEGDTVDVTGSHTGTVTAVNDDGTLEISLSAVDPTNVKTAEPTMPAAEELDALIASAAPVAPPGEWFKPFDLGGPTPLTVTAAGRVYGHLATWGSCHTDFAGKCMGPPSDTNPEFFHMGTVLTAEGDEIPVGKVTVGGGHAQRDANMVAALEHYDDVSTGVAIVQAHEDEHGIALFGSVVPEATPEQVAALRRSPLSGDWRRQGRSLRLIGAHAVNSPAFPIPRGLVASGGPHSLIVTGRVTGRHAVLPTDLNAVRERLARSIGRDQATLRKQYAERINGGM